MAYDIKGLHFKVLQTIMTTNRMPTRHVVCAIIQDTIKMELPVRATLPSALNVMNASSVGKPVQLVTASMLILYHKGRIDPMKDECHYQVKH